MPITVTEFEEKKYIIDGAEFKLKKPTLGIKRRGAALTSILVLKLQELSTLSEIYLKDVEEATQNQNKNKKKAIKTSIDLTVSTEYRVLCDGAEKINAISEEVFIKAEELFKIILEPVKPEDTTKLIADNIDEKMIPQVIQDFFQHARLSMTPVNN